MNKDDYSIEEYRLAHEELMELWRLFWRQASYFLTLSAVLVAFVSAAIQFFPIYPLLLILAVFGVAIAVIWLFHGNRFFLYIRVTEEKMRHLEQEDDRLTMKLKCHQEIEYSDKKASHCLEKYSGHGIRNTVLPVIVIVIWVVIIGFISCKLAVGT